MQEAKAACGKAEALAEDAPCSSIGKGLCECTATCLADAQQPVDSCRISLSTPAALEAPFLRNLFNAQDNEQGEEVNEACEDATAAE